MLSTYKTQPYREYLWCVNRGAERWSVRLHIAVPAPWFETPSPFGVEGPSDRSPLPCSRCSTGTETGFENVSSLLRRAYRRPPACRAAWRWSGWQGSDAGKHRCLDFCADSGRENHTTSGCRALLPWRRWGGIESGNPADTSPGQSSCSGEDTKQINSHRSLESINHLSVEHSAVEEVFNALFQKAGLTNSEPTWAWRKNHQRGAVTMIYHDNR